jgi:MFS transporter, DHA1 family, multidrug resistance protein
LRANRSGLFVISLPGALSVVSRFAIDMYLPAFAELAAGFGVPSTTVALTLSSYFIGLAAGLGTGAVISTVIGAATPDDRLPVVAIFGVTAAVGLAILLAGRKRAAVSPVAEEPEPVVEPKREAGCEPDHAAGGCEACRL